jgi:hypothetical protein
VEVNGVERMGIVVGVVDYFDLEVVNEVRQEEREVG